jgi:SAM-dependent methyltransferase
MANSDGQRESGASLYDQVRAALQQKQFDVARKHLDFLLAQNADDAVSFSLMSDLAAATDDVSGAIDYAVMAVKAEPENVEYKKKFIALAGNLVFRKYFPQIEFAVLSCLETPEAEFEYAFTLWFSVLLTVPYFRQLYQQVRRRAWFNKVFLLKKNPFDALRDLRPLFYPFFLLGLKRLIVPSLQFEGFITSLRAFLLEQFICRNPKLSAHDFLQLAVPVAHYAFHANYILDVTKDEQRGIDALRLRLETADQAAIDARSLALLACYTPLYRLKNAEALAGHFKDQSDLAALMDEQITHDIALQQRIPAVPVLTPVEDAVSKNVREQYEAHPYPRWNEIGYKFAPWSAKLVSVLEGEGASVLIAGCGTGRDTCRLALSFPKAGIVAIDISRASVAYALSKAEKYGLTNIRFAQADILNLGSLNQRFDYIQTFGVLHHMRDPEKGWAILTGLLKPGGIMLVGLYSKAARRAVTEARTAIAKGNYEPTPESMRKFRRQTSKLLGKESRSILEQTPEYYTLNSYRDLLFHAHEDPFDIPRIKAALGSLGLEFMGFKFSDQTAYSQYQQQFPDDGQFANLDNWHTFETHHPDTFGACYTFLCRKS